MNNSKEPVQKENLPDEIVLVKCYYCEDEETSWFPIDVEKLKELRKRGFRIACIQAI